MFLGMKVELWQVLQSSAPFSFSVAASSPGKADELWHLHTKPNAADESHFHWQSELKDQSELTSHPSAAWAIEIQ